MSQIFRRSTNTFTRVTIFGAVFILGFATWAIDRLSRSDYATRATQSREQPVPFSHAHHVGGLGVDCRYCHTTVETSSFANIPPTKTCMNCHSQIWSTSPTLEPVRASFRTNQSIRWTRVNDLPDFVYFNHSIHVNKGVGCNTCHGPVDQMPLMYQQESLQMEWCLSCHRAPQNNLRPRSEVFNMRYQQPTGANPVVVDGQSFTDQTDLGTALVKKYNVRNVKDITTCSTCHR